VSGMFEQGPLARIASLESALEEQKHLSQRRIADLKARAEEAERALASERAAHKATKAAAIEVEQLTAAILEFHRARRQATEIKIAFADAGSADRMQRSELELQRVVIDKPAKPEEAKP